MPRDGHGYRSLTEVAREMGTSSRTLKRQLAARGTQFSAILEGLRHDRALRLLADASLPLTAVAHQLGYADLAGFTRAFRRWTGTSPGAYRKAKAANVA
ncbi:MAG TPA: helix-turn-helix transcriptional regulator [Kofleriaceae bacterium]